METRHWLLPEGIDELLPPQAMALEQLRRRLLDLYASWGYELVFPPFIEYLESLLSGTGGDLDLATFKLTDQLSGRTLGVRADITPQVARIDAHQLRREQPTRLCYVGTVLKTRSDGFAASRAPVQVGAELFGHDGAESDLEILLLMLETLEAAGIEAPYIDLGHVGIFRGLARQAGLDQSQELALFDALQRKAVPEIGSLVASYSLDPAIAGILLALPGLSGDDALTRAESLLAGAGEAVKASLAELKRVADLLLQQRPGLKVHFDLSELRGYHYHTGLVFAAFLPGLGQEVARGGRYDQIGEIFGRARPARGFSADLKQLLRLGHVDPQATRRVFAPAAADSALEQRIAQLRTGGVCVIRELPGQSGSAVELGCDGQLVKQDQAWEIEALS